MAILITTFSVSGCTKIDLLPVSEKSVDGFYQNETHINQALIGAYSGFQSLFVNSSQSYGLYESRSDNAWQITLAYPDGEVSQFNVSPLNSLLSSAWNGFYNEIMRANRVLESLENIELDESKRNRYEAEAKFIRALCYFDLVRLFGGVPKVTSVLTVEEGYEAVKASDKEIYDLIVEDLSFAANNLPDSYEASQSGRATSWAAKGFLGKVYVFRSGYPLKLNEWDLAKTQFESIINSGNFEFFDNYAAIYNHENEGGRQQLFSVQFKYDQAGNQFPGRNAPNTISKLPINQGGFPFVGSPYQLFVSKELVNSFEEGDIRKEVAIRTRWLNNGNSWITNDPFSQKYQNGPVQPGSNSWDIDWILLSYTDVLMMYAETLNELGYSPNGEAFNILNRVRERAGLNPKTAAEVPNQESYRLWMENERRWEFCFENLRWFDLVRTDRALNVMKEFLGEYNLSANLKSKNQYIYPIPQTVRDITPEITQNEGYN